MIAPLYEAVPPRLYGGTERIVSGLTEQLVKCGHDVTLFASGDSVTSAELCACVPVSLRTAGAYSEGDALTLRMLSTVYKRAGEFDVIHNHSDWMGLPFGSLAATPSLTTMHGRLDLPFIKRRFELFPNARLVSISRDQRSYLPHNTWIGTVYNGIDCSHLPFSERPGDYLVFIGRLSPEKRPDLAVEIAERAGMKLIVAAKVDPTEQDYFDDCIGPLFASSSFVEYVGEVGDADKGALLGGAYANVFPIDWPEPFGLTMVEAMATGTPVVAMNRGSVPEVVADGKTGFVCTTVDEMVAALDRIDTISRRACRDRVDELFSTVAMVSAYEQIYMHLVDPQD